MTKEQIANFLYEKYLLTAPIIFDLIAAYGRSNLAVLRQFIETAFKIEPKYQHDLIESLQFFVKSLDEVQENIFESNADTFEDLALYILDCGHTINTLLTILPSSNQIYDICRENKFEQKITHFYDDSIPKLHRNMEHIMPDSISLQYLKFARIEFINFFRCLVKKCTDDVIQAT